MASLIRTAFEALPIHARFHRNGNEWFKVSTRTARLNGNGRVMYFRLTETVLVDEYELTPRGVT